MVFAIPVSSPRKIYFNEIYSSRKFSRVKRYLSNISGKIDHFYFQGSLRNDKRKEKNINSKSHRIIEISRFFEIIITIEHISNRWNNFSRQYRITIFPTLDDTPSSFDRAFIPSTPFYDPIYFISPIPIRSIIVLSDNNTAIESVRNSLSRVRR